MAGTAHYPLKVLEVFRYFFHGRRSGIIRTSENFTDSVILGCFMNDDHFRIDLVDDSCVVSSEKDAQSLVGLPNGTWEVRPPQMTVPLDLMCDLVFLPEAVERNPSPARPSTCLHHIKMSKNILLTVEKYKGDS